MGILDQFTNMSPEQTNGLLAAAAQILQRSGDPRRPFGIGQALGAGIETYQGSTEAARQVKQHEAQQAQMAQMRDLQMQEQRQQMADQSRARNQQQQVDNAARDSVRPGGLTFPSSFGMPEQAPSEFDQNAYIDRLMKIDPMKAMQARAQFAPKAKELKETTTEQVDGKPVRVNWYKDGSHEVVSGLAPREKMEFMDLKDRRVAFNPMEAKPGDEYKIGQSPESAASQATSLTIANMSDKRARDLNLIGQEANTIKRAEKQKDLDMTKNSQLASFDTMLGTLDRLSKHPGLPGSVGLRGMIPAIPGSEAANFGAELETFQSQAFIPMVAQLKGMGALSDAEGRKLTAAVGALNPKMGEKAFRESVARITADMQGAYDRVAGGKAAPKPAAAPAASIPQGAISYLKMNPNLTAEFDAKFGQGAAARVLGR